MATEGTKGAEPIHESCDSEYMLCDSITGDGWTLSLRSE
jgi:hypothetical protein